MIITISGTPGSGKSTVARRLSRRLRYPHTDIGQIRRNIAKRLGLTLEQYTRLSETDHRPDRDVDAYQQALGRKHKNYVVEGRLSFHFIPQSFKVFLYVSPTVGAERILKQLRSDRMRNEGVRLKTRAAVLRSIRRRMASDRRRYQQYYRVNPFLRRHYDCYLDTSHLPPSAVLQKVWESMTADRLVPRKTRWVRER